jgi:hypothetical protein
MVTLNINGQVHQVDVPLDMPLLWALRDVVGLTGIHGGGKLIAESAMFKRNGLVSGSRDSMQHATLQCTPGKLREACLKVAPHPETLPRSTRQPTSSMSSQA